MNSPNPPPRSGPPSGCLWTLAGLLAVGVLVLVLARRFPEALSSRGAQVNLVYMLALLAFVGGSVALGWRRNRPGLGKAARYGAIWLAIAGVVALAYLLRHEGGRLWSELSPASGLVEGQSIRFPLDAEGHFIVEARVNGIPLRFMVDTGASDVVLSPADARRLGFTPDKLVFNRRYGTANGVVMGAPVRLRQVAVGPIVLENVRASVNAAPMGRSLLGMSFLSRLSGYEVARDHLTLRR